MFFKHFASKNTLVKNGLRTFIKQSSKSKRLFKRKKKYELEKHLKHVETSLELLQDLKYEGQERMISGDEENEAVNVGELWE